MTTVKRIFKMTNDEIDEILSSKTNFAYLVERVALFDPDIFNNVRKLKLMSIEDLIKKLPRELVQHELKSFVIYKPKTNK